MLKVYCSNSDCTGYDCGLCNREYICIGNNEEEICEQYENYLTTGKYEHEYYISVKTKDGTIAKGLKKGMKIEYNGFIFFTQSDYRHPQDFVVTEKISGYNCGYFERLKEPERWEQFLKLVKNIKNVEDYPLAKYDGKSRQWIIKE